MLNIFSYTCGPALYFMWKYVYLAFCFHFYFCFDIELNKLFILNKLYILDGLPWWFSGKDSANAGDVGLIPGLQKSLREGNGNPLQYSCLKNPMGRGAAAL